MIEKNRGIEIMSQLRFVKTPEQLVEAAENNLEFFDANMHAIKAWYKTEPGLIEQLDSGSIRATCRSNGKNCYFSRIC